MSEDNVELVRRGYAAMLTGDLDAIEALLAPDVKWHAGDPEAEGACHDRGEALAFMRAARRRGPLGELVDVVDAGDRVVVVIRRPDGALGSNVTTVRDGQVVDMRHYPDPAGALAAVGAAPRRY